MSSERLAIALSAVLALAGCGNYSNSEVEFLNAIPSREDLQTNLPVGSSSAKAEPGVVRAALAPELPALGMTSKLYEDTQGASDFFSAIAEFFVGLIDEVQRLPPSEQGPDFRQWGPFAPGDLPNIQLRVVIQRAPALPTHYTYEFAFLKTGDAAWTPFLLGSFDSSGQARTGVGHLAFANRALVLAGLQKDPSLQELDTLAIDYDNRADPKTVSTTFTFVAGAGALSSSHEDWADGRGTMAFDVDDWQQGILLHVTSSWLATGEGRADALISDISGPLGAVAQCWDGGSLLTWHASTYEAPNLLGSESACPTDLITP